MSLVMFMWGPIYLLKRVVPVELQMAVTVFQKLSSDCIWRQPF